MKYQSFIALLTLLLLVFLVTSSHGELHVSTSGSDSNSGSESSPFATIKGAIQHIKSNGGVPTSGEEIIVHSGIYFTNSTITMDSTTLPGTSVSKKVVIKKASDETSPRISGGIHLDSSLFRTLDSQRDSNVYNRIESSVRNFIRVTNITKQGIKDVGTLKPRGGMKGLINSAPMELFCNDKRMTLGRWPNEDETNEIDLFSLNSIVLTGNPSPEDVTGTYIRNGTTSAAGYPVFQRAGLVNGHQYRIYRLTGKGEIFNWTRWFISRDPVLTRWPTLTPIWWQYTNLLRQPFSPNSGASGYVHFGDEFCLS